MGKFVGVVGVALAVLAVAAGGANAATDDAERSVVEGINAVRAKHGLKPLTVAPKLAASAERWSSAQLNGGFYGHASSIRTAASFRTLGEVIFLHGGTKPRVRQTISGWMHSPVHNSLLLSPAFRYAGAGLARGSYNGGKAAIWTVQLGG